MLSLIVALMVWISQATGLPFPQSMPNVVLRSEAELCITFDLGCVDGDNTRILGAYDDDTDTIYLLPTWHMKNLAHTSTLLHELVHFMQDQAAATYPCPQEREKEAYGAEIAWWEAMGLDYFDTLQRDRLFHMLLTTCHLHH